jgi:hypothetical protein
MLKAKAEYFSDRLSIVNFKCSEGWLCRFKVRKGISHHKITGEACGVKPEAVEEWTPIVAEYLKKYSPHDVYNADETALFYNLLPDKTLAVRGDSCKGGKRSKERLTVLLCTNMDGSDKIKPMVIGKWAQPRCFKGIKNLPCRYEHNAKAWMTSGLFAQWLRAFDARIGGKNRKVVSFVDNCPAHPKIDLGNTELVFLPPNATSILQPLDQGTIKLLKHHYRAMLVNFTVRQLELKNFTRMKWNTLDAMRAVVSSWGKISADVIASCFKHAGFSAHQGDVIELENNLEDPEGWEER